MTAAEHCYDLPPGAGGRAPKTIETLISNTNRGPPWLTRCRPTRGGQLWHSVTNDTRNEKCRFTIQSQGASTICVCVCGRYFFSAINFNGYGLLTAAAVDRLWWSLKEGWAISYLLLDQGVCGEIWVATSWMLQIKFISVFWIKSQHNSREGRFDYGPQNPASWSDQLFRVADNLITDYNLNIKNFSIADFSI